MNFKASKILLAGLLLASAVYASEDNPTKEEVAKLYVATFNRAPDSAGLNYWTNDSGLKLSQIAKSFFDQPETKLLYPSGITNTDFITAVYKNLFNRIPDNEGLTYWNQQLKKGAFSKDQFIEAIINGAQNDDIKILDNKTTIGLDFVNNGLNDKNLAVSVMNNISAVESSVDDALSIISSKANIQTGIFADAPVEGLNYTTLTQNGFTDEQGHFKYKDGETVEFKLGTLSLGKGKAEAFVTPYNISDNNTTATNIAMVLQNFDANRSNTQVLNLSKLKDFNFSADENTRDINISATPSVLQNELATVLSTGSFQSKVDDTNLTLITETEVKANMDDYIHQYNHPVVTTSTETNATTPIKTNITTSVNSTQIKSLIVGKTYYVAVTDVPNHHVETLKFNRDEKTFTDSWTNEDGTDKTSTYSYNIKDDTLTLFGTSEDGNFNVTESNPIEKDSYIVFSDGGKFYKTKEAAQLEIDSESPTSDTNQTIAQ